jgi:hypothetical protein
MSSCGRSSRVDSIAAAEEAVITSAAATGAAATEAAATGAAAMRAGAIGSGDGVQQFGGHYIYSQCWLCDHTGFKYVMVIYHTRTLAIENSSWQVCHAWRFTYL